DHPQGGMIDHQMPAALLAVLPLAEGRCLDGADVFGAGRHANRVGLPERERIDRSSRPRSARAAVTITHALGLARGFEMDRSAEAFTFVCRHGLPDLVRLRAARVA